jgi:hypothetical protein
MGEETELLILIRRLDRSAELDFLASLDIQVWGPEDLPTIPWDWSGSRRCLLL